MHNATDYAALFDASPYPYLLIDRQLTVISANRAYFEAAECTTDIIGKTLAEGLPGLVEQGAEALLKEVFTSGVASVAHRVRASAGQRPAASAGERYLDLCYQPVVSEDGKVSGVFIQGHDVTGTLEAVDAQREADERLREGMLAARMVIWDMDLATGTVQFSENARAVFGNEWNTRQAVWAALHPDDVKKLHAARARAIAERSEYEEYVRLMRPNEKGFLWVRVKGTIRCNEAGAPVSVRGVAVDVTERMRAEEDLREADRRKDEFLAMLAHELRNPLAPISAAAQILRMPTLKPEMIRRTSEVISRQVRHMTSLVDDLLDVSRVTRGLVALDRRRLCITDVVTDAVEQVRPLINSRRQELTVRLPPERIELIGDQKRLVQVLTNLLNNAAKYTAEAGVVELTVTTSDQEVAINIRDNGIGISAELLPQIFDLFTQAERTPDRSQGGLGLGLALVRSLVALHGGSVSASSPGQGLGAVFTVQLPRIADTASAAATDGRLAAAARHDKGLRLLVVDDNTDAAEMLGAFMESAGHQVTIEHEPYQAMERARVEQPDVCLLDIGLPGMDGNQLARCLRMMPQMSKATLIAVTGYGKEFDRDTSIAAGFDYYFVKPADPLALVALLEKLQVA